MHMTLSHVPATGERLFYLPAIHILRYSGAIFINSSVLSDSEALKRRQPQG